MKKSDSPESTNKELDGYGSGAKSQHRLTDVMKKTVGFRNKMEPALKNRRREGRQRAVVIEPPVKNVADLKPRSDNRSVIKPRLNSSWFKERVIYPRLNPRPSAAIIGEIVLSAKENSHSC
eukprot:6210806-Pleurochrysis_carterae.AAC.1